MSSDFQHVRAAELMGRLYDLLDASGYGGHDLDLLLVRLVFIMFADDTSVWEKNRPCYSGCRSKDQIRHSSLRDSRRSPIRRSYAADARSEPRTAVTFAVPRPTIAS